MQMEPLPSGKIVTNGPADYRKDVQPMTELSKQIARTIMVDIVSGKYSTDIPFPKESELCEQYKVSRVVIREAKKRIQALGMLQTKKKAGSSITPKLAWNFFNQDLFSLYLRHSNDFEQQMENYYAMRRLLEPAITAQVALTASPACIATLGELVDTMSRAYHSNDITPLLQADLDFHLKIYEASNNILVYPLANLMTPLFLKGFTFSMRDWGHGLKEHVETVQAIAAHDAERARYCALEVIERGYERYLQGLVAYKAGSEKEKDSFLHEEI